MRRLPPQHASGCDVEELPSRRAGARSSLLRASGPAADLISGARKLVAGIRKPRRHHATGIARRTTVIAAARVAARALLGWPLRTGALKDRRRQRWYRSGTAIVAVAATGDHEHARRERNDDETRDRGTFGD